MPSRKVRSLTGLIVPADLSEPMRLQSWIGNERDLLYGLQQTVGGYVEQVKTRLMASKRVMLVDEEGFYKPDQMVNHRAMRLSGYAGVICNTAVFVELSTRPLNHETVWTSWTTGIPLAHANAFNFFE